MDVGRRSARSGHRGRRPSWRAARGPGGLAVRAVRRAGRDPARARAGLQARVRRDEGPNTGGMGAYAPVPRIRRPRSRLVEQVHRPVLGELARVGAVQSGLLYAGLMLTDDGPEGARVQLPVRRSRDAGLLPLLESDLSRRSPPLRGDLASCSPTFSSSAATRSCWRPARIRQEATAAVRSRVSGRGGSGALVFHAGHGAAWRPARDERRTDSCGDRPRADVAGARTRRTRRRDPVRADAVRHVARRRFGATLRCRSRRSGEHGPAWGHPAPPPAVSVSASRYVGARPCRMVPSGTLAGN
jgi:hypothetical protein